MKVLFIVGYAACGKSTYVESIRQSGDEIIETGDIVRKLSGKETRVFASNMDKKIIQHLRARILQSNAKRIIVTSARNINILEAVRETAGKDNVDIVLLKTSYQDRLNRFKYRNAGKDSGMLYDEVLKGDRKLGLDDLILQLKIEARSNPHVKIVPW